MADQYEVFVAPDGANAIRVKSDEEYITDLEAERDRLREEVALRRTQLFHKHDKEVERLREALERLGGILLAAHEVIADTLNPQEADTR